MKIGDLVRFAKEHSSLPGLEYCGSWLGCITKASDKIIEIHWMGLGARLTRYDEQWWGELDYEPFEVVNENR